MFLVLTEAKGILQA